MEPLWQNSYLESCPKTISIEQDSVVDVFEQSCAKHANRTAFSCMGERLSYEELHRYAVEFAAYLQQHKGIRKGDRIAIMMPNILQYPVVLFGILMCGAVVVNLNPLDKAQAIRHELKDSGSKVIVVLENFVDELQEVVKDTDIQQVVLTSIGALFSPFKRTLVNFVVRHIKNMVPKWHLPGAVRFRKTLKLGRESTFTPVSIQHDDLAFLQYTSGTTGRPKAAMLSHGNMLANLAQADAWIGHLFQPGDCIITALPMYHIFSLLANCLVFIQLGGENRLITNPRDIPGFLRTLNKYPYQAMSGVNTLFNALLMDEHFSDLDFESLKLVLGGGMSVVETTAQQWHEVTGVPITQAYGLTEASPAVTISLPGQPFNGGVGFPIPSTEISVREPDGNEVDINEPGELWVRGPQVMQGYWHNDAATADVLTEDGWLKTGDLASVDESGVVRILDRLKDVIIVSGFNVTPGEVESIISEIEGVAEVGVVGVPDQIHGELVKACVVLKPGAHVSEDLVKGYCHKRLAAYKSPKLVSFYDELPKSHVGKILRRELRELS